MVQNQHMSKCLVGCRDHAKSRRVATHLDLKVKWMKTDNPDTGDIYAGLDRFGRITDCRWRNTSTDSDLSRTQYGYDRDSNRLWRKNPTDPNSHYDWLYNYDGLQRLKNGNRGTLNSAHDAITDPQFKQCWSLDATSNWNGFQQSNNGTDWNLIQSRTSNTVNEITAITDSTGPSWATPTYDRNGNMNVLPQGADPTKGYAATYDAWNRLVKLTDTSTSDTVQENQYDARNFRVIRQDYANNTLSETRHFYYTDSWQDIEQRLNSSTDPDQQNVWGIRYIDDLVLRDRFLPEDSNSSSSSSTSNFSLERLYACQDANWNTTAIVDTNGEVQERYEYDPYGNTTFLTPDNTVRTASSYNWTTLFTGRALHSVTLIYDFRARSYLTGVGTFSTRDPLEYVDGMGLYTAWFVPDGVDPLGWGKLFTPILTGPWNPIIINMTPQQGGAIQLAGGGSEILLGTAGLMTPEPTMTTKVLGIAGIVHGVDQCIAALRTLYSGETTPTFVTLSGTRALQSTGLDPIISGYVAGGFDATLGIVSSAGTGYFTSPSQVANRSVQALRNQLIVKGVTQGKAGVIVTPNLLRSYVLPGISSRAGGAGVEGLTEETRLMVTQFASDFNHACAEPQCVNLGNKLGANFKGGASKVLDIKKGETTSACKACKPLLDHLGVSDVSK